MERNLYFEKIGTDVSGINSVKEVLKISNLDYTVESQNIYLKNGLVVPNKFANVRIDKNKILGVVGKNYKIVQNIEGFKILDEFIATGFEFASAGAFNDGVGAFILLKQNGLNFGNDKFISYLLFTNNFDGSGTIKVEFTPIRESCNSVFLLLDKNIDTKISIRHCNQPKDQILTVNEIINSLNKYNKFLTKTINSLISRKSNIEDFNNILKEIIPIDDKMSNIIKLRAENTREDIKNIYNELLIEDSAYKIVLAFANYESHRAPLRDTKNDYIYIDRVINGMELTNNAFKFIVKRLL